MTEAERPRFSCVPRLTHSRAACSWRSDRSRTPSRAIAVFLALLPLLAAPLRAQDAAAPVFRDTVDVRVVNVEVVVVDDDGKRVRGLLPSDFEVRIEGKPVPIAYFSEVADGRVTTLPKDGAGEVEPALRAGDAVERSYLVFIDEFFSLPADRERIVRSLIGDLETLAVGDRMAITAWNGDEIAILSHWTTSADRLLDALQQALKRPALGAERRMEQRPVASPQRQHSLGAMSAADLSAVPDVEAVRELELKMAVDRMDRQMTAATSAAAATLRAFSLVPGRKVMLLLSGGWPRSPADLLAENEPASLLEFWTDAEEVFGRLPAAANRLGFTIYPVDVPDSTLDYGLSSAGDADPSGSLSSGADLRRGSQLRHTLHLLAERTGGQIVIGGDRDNAFELVARDTSSYYSIGIRPAGKEDDRPKDIGVEVAKNGLRVRTRSNYLDLSPQRSVSMLLESALLFDEAPVQHEIPVKLGDAKKGRRGTVEVPLSIAIPVDRVTFLQRDGLFVADLSLDLAFRDDKGQQTEDLPATPFQVRLKKRPQPGTYVRYDTKVQIRNRTHRIAVGVRDQTGGAILTGTTEYVTR